MISCQLKKESNGKSWTATAKHTESGVDPMGGHGIINSRKQSISSASFSEIVEFLITHGVAGIEINIALQEMEKNEHNLAEFGWYGSFMFSRYEGPLH